MVNSLSIKTLQSYSFNITLLQDDTYRGNLYGKSSPDLWNQIRHMPYDFTSVTHVGPFEHAKDSRKPTVSSKYPGVYFGDHMELSVIDVQKLRTLYRCQQGKCEQLMFVHKVSLQFQLQVIIALGIYILYL